MTNVSAQQFRGILNDHPVAKSLFKDFKPGEVYLFEVTVYVNDVLHGNTCRITIFDDKTGLHRSAELPSAYLQDLFIPYNTPAAKVLFGGNGGKFD